MKTGFPGKSPKTDTWKPQVLHLLQSHMEKYPDDDNSVSGHDIGYDSAILNNYPDLVEGKTSLETENEFDPNDIYTLCARIPLGQEMIHLMRFNPRNSTYKINKGIVIQRLLVDGEKKLKVLMFNKNTESSITDFKGDIQYLTSEITIPVNDNLIEYARGCYCLAYKSGASVEYSVKLKDIIANWGNDTLSFRRPPRTTMTEPGAGSQGGGRKSKSRPKRTGKRKSKTQKKKRSKKR